VPRVIPYQDRRCADYLTLPKDSVERGIMSTHVFGVHL